MILFFTFSWSSVDGLSEFSLTDVVWLKILSSKSPGMKFLHFDNLSNIRYGNNKNIGISNCLFVRLGLHMLEIRSWDRAIETASIVNAHMKEQYWVTPPPPPTPQKRKKILPFEEASNNGLSFCC